MKKLFAATAAMGMFVACMELGEPIQAGPGEIENPAGASSDSTGALEQVYNEVLALLFPSDLLEEVSGISLDTANYTRQLSEACAEQLTNPQELTVPPVIERFAYGIAEKVNTEMEADPLRVLALFKRLLKIYDDNIVAVRAEIPASCHIILQAVDGYDYLPDTGEAFVTRFLNMGLEEGLITASDHADALEILELLGD